MFWLWRLAFAHRSPKHDWCGMFGFSDTVCTARCRLAPRLPQHLASLARHLGASNLLGKLPARSAAVVTRGFAQQLNAPSPANIAWRFAKPRTVQAVVIT